MEKTSYFTDCAYIPLRGETSTVLLIQGMYIVSCGCRRITHLFFLFLAWVAWLMITVDRSTYLWASRAITFTKKDPLSLEYDWYQWIGLASSSPAWLLSPTSSVTLEKQLWKWWQPLKIRKLPDLLKLNFSPIKRYKCANDNSIKSKSRFLYLKQNRFSVRQKEESSCAVERNC